jgi:NAD(P)-dependent dehydrogenase (short-subunit alcohol dehydrogenase family)
MIHPRRNQTVSQLTNNRPAAAAWPLWVAGVLAGVGLFALSARRRRHRQDYWRDKVVVITGGARGLGLELARVWLARGARVAICSRSPRDVERAFTCLGRDERRVLGLVCDVTNETEVRRLIDRVCERWGEIDAVVNNAGVMTVGPLDCMREDDFRVAMETHFWAPLHVVEAALPHLKRRRGHVVNIASIGGELSVPHMLPYSASKFALVGLSEGLRVELAATGVHVTTVCPGLMRTGSPRNARFKGRHRDEYAWFSISGSLPLVSIDSAIAARRIVEATTRRRAYLALSLPAKLAIRAHGLFPGLAARALGLVHRLLPPVGGIGNRSASGADSASRLSPSLLTVLTERAARRNNEIS